MDEVKALIKKLSMDFQDRSILRELSDLLFNASPAGEIDLQVETWAKEWKLEESKIWSVIDLVEATKFWTIEQGLRQSVLKCTNIQSASKSISAKKKRTALASVKLGTEIDRAKALTLAKANPSLISEVTEKIPANLIKHALEEGYTGWLPCSSYGISGHIYRPDKGIKDKLSVEFPGICIDSCLAIMFDDLKHSHKHRPTMPRFPFWIRQWLKKNPDRVMIEKTDAEKAQMIAQRMDDY